MSGEPPEGEQAPDEPTTILPTPHHQAAHGDVQAMQGALSADVADEPATIPHTPGLHAGGIRPNDDPGRVHDGDFEEPTTILASTHVHDDEPTTILHAARTDAISMDVDLGPVHAGDVEEPATLLTSMHMHEDEPATILHTASTGAMSTDADLGPVCASTVAPPTTILASPHVHDDEPTTILRTPDINAISIGPDPDPGPVYAGDAEAPTTIPTSPYTQDDEPTTILQSASPDQRPPDEYDAAGWHDMEAEEQVATPIEMEAPATLLTSPHEHDDEPTTILQSAEADQPPSDDHDAAARDDVEAAKQAATLAIEVEAPATLLTSIHEHDDEPTTILQPGPDQPPLTGPEPGHDAADKSASAVTGAGGQGEVAPIHQAQEDAQEPADHTEILPSAGVAGLADLPEEAGGQVSSRAWFDRRMRDFNHALLHTQNGEKRAVAERQALAAAARDMIQRVGLRDQEQKDGAWADTVLHADQLLVNTYFVRALIARGGVGEIYRARHRDLKTEHAIKILLPRYALDPTVLNLLLEEARLLQRVRHEAVVGCQGLLRDSDGRPMLVMDYLRGHTLSARLREGAMPTAELVQLAGRLAAGLGALHAQRLVHLDISPDNIMLVDDSCAAATIIDFGLARSLDAPENTHRNIDFAGKYSWCSPEQLSNRVANVDARSDLYSLGLVLLAAARGFRLDMGQDLETARDARQSVPSLAGIEEPIATLLRHLLAPSASARLKSAAEVPNWLKGKRPGMIRRLFAR